MLPARWYRVCRLAWNPLPARRRPRPCRGPYRGRFRSDNHATVLRLPKTQPKDRRVYNAPYRNPCRTADARGGRQVQAQTGQGRLHCFLSTLTKSAPIKSMLYQGALLWRTISENMETDLFPSRPAYSVSHQWKYSCGLPQPFSLLSWELKASGYHV